jgi:hypothetical protein
MYRIELAPGEETVFRTIEELAVAVRNGLVTPRCRIYHNATQKWLPIEFHPHYKQALSLPAARIAEAVAPRTSGHPPRLETLSFAVAKSTPAPEPVAEPAAEARVGDHPVQPPAQPLPQVERPAQDRSPTKRPVGPQRVGRQAAELRGAEHPDAARGGTEHSGKDHSGTTRSITDHPAAAHSATAHSATGHSATGHSPTAHSPKEASGAEHSGADHSGADHSGADHSGAEHSGADHLDARYSGVEHPITRHAVENHSATGRAVTQHSSVQHSVPEHAVTEHPVTDLQATKHGASEHPATKHRASEHPAPKHPATDHPPTDHPASDHAAWGHAATTHSAAPHTAADEAAAPAAVEHPVLEHSSAAASPTEPPVIESPYPAHPAAERLPASRAAAEHPFASPAHMAAEPPIHAEPAPDLKSKSSYRPDSYLPPSVRVIADDPYVAIAPEPAAVPSVPAAPRRSWSMLPAVQETPELPAISYPEITPAEEPVAERANSSRGHRPLQVAVALLVLAAGGYLAKSFYSPVHGSRVDNSSTPAAAVADRPALPEDAPPPAPSAVRTKPSPDRPSVITPTAPASSGFAAALEPRAIATGPAPVLSAHGAEPSSAASTADSNGVTGPIAPAPAEMQMDVPALPGGDSLVAQPRSKSDSAMKRILRAVSGGKDAR